MPDADPLCPPVLTPDIKLGLEINDPRPKASHGASRFDGQRMDHVLQDSPREVEQLARKKMLPVRPFNNLCLTKTFTLPYKPGQPFSQWSYLGRLGSTLQVDPKQAQSARLIPLTTPAAAPRVFDSRSPRRNAEVWASPAKQSKNGRIQEGRINGGNSATFATLIHHG